MNIDFIAGYSTAWLVIASAGLVGAACLNGMLARLPGSRSALGRSLRWATVAAVFAVFTLPAQVPEATQVHAPAFIILLFETMFQAQGSPSDAVRIMLVQVPLVFLSALALCMFGHWAVARLKRVASGNSAANV